MIPVGPAGDKNVGVWPDADFAVQAAGRNHQQFAVDRVGQRRSANRAKAAAVPGLRQVEQGDFFFSGGPGQPGPRREQIGGVGRSGILAAIFAVAEIKAVEIALYRKGHFAAQTGS